MTDIQLYTRIAEREVAKAMQMEADNEARRMQLRTWKRRANRPVSRTEKLVWEHAGGDIAEVSYD